MHAMHVNAQQVRAAVIWQAVYWVVSPPDSNVISAWPALSARQIIHWASADPQLAAGFEPQLCCQERPGTETLPQSPLGGSLPSKSILQSAHKTTRQHLELQVCLPFGGRGLGQGMVRKHDERKIGMVHMQAGAFK
eukprot:121639-Chlamydomonas_euryale.AAC.12